MNKRFNVWISVLGFSREQEGELRLHTRLVLFRRKQIWALRCSARNDSAVHSLPETGQTLHPYELFALGFALLWRDAVTMKRRATNVPRGKWYRQDTNGLHRSQQTTGRF